MVSTSQSLVVAGGTQRDPGACVCVCVCEVAFIFYEEQVILFSQIKMGGGGGGGGEGGESEGGEEVEEEVEVVEVVEEEEPAPPVSPTCSLLLSLKNNIGLHLCAAPCPTHQPGYGCRASARCDMTLPRLLLPVSRPRSRSHVFHHWSKCQYD